MRTCPPLVDLIEKSAHLIDDLTIKKEKPDKKTKNKIICQKAKIFLTKVAIYPKYPNLSILTLPITLSIEGTIV